MAVRIEGKIRVELLTIETQPGALLLRSIRFRPLLIPRVNLRTAKVHLQLFSVLLPFPNPWVSFGGKKRRTEAQSDSESQQI